MESDGNASEIQVRLAPIVPQDLPILFEFQSDAESNRLAAMHPRSRDEFNAHWARISNDSEVISRSIRVNDVMAGSINSFCVEDQRYVGYWVGKKYWGQGVATRALSLLLDEVITRPLHARVSASNIASIRVLQKSGFEIVGREHSPGSERFLECEEVLLELAEYRG